MVVNGERVPVFKGVDDHEYYYAREDHVWKTVEVIQGAQTVAGTPVRNPVSANRGQSFNEQGNTGTLGTSVPNQSRSHPNLLGKPNPATAGTGQLGAGSGNAANVSSNMLLKKTIPQPQPIKKVVPTPPTKPASPMVASQPGKIGSPGGPFAVAGAAGGDASAMGNGSRPSSGSSSNSLIKGVPGAVPANSSNSLSNGASPGRGLVREESGSSVTSVSSTGGGSSGSSKPTFSITFRWAKGELLGKGAHGHVYQALDLDTGKLMAVKQFDLVDLAGDESLVSIASEIELLKDLNHPNIVKYLGSEINHTNLNIFLEYVPGGSLGSMIDRFGAFSEKVAKIYIRQILVGCEYLHSHGVIHRDIKAANILVTETGQIKLADFGCSKLVAIDESHTPGTSFMGTPFFLAPEIVKHNMYGRKSDVWSIGCTALQLLSGKPPWGDLSNAFAVVFKIGNTTDPPPYPPSLSPHATDFLNKCFAIDPTRRPTVPELMKHPWFDE